MQEDLTPRQFICTHIFRWLNFADPIKIHTGVVYLVEAYLPDLVPFRKGPDMVERYLLDILKSTKLGRMLQKPVSIYDPILLEPTGERKQIW